MKIEAVKNVIITLDPETKNNVEHGPGEPFDLDDKEAAFLISHGLAKEAGKEADDGKGTNAPAATNTDKRAALEQKALDLGIGTAEEIKVLPDSDLGAKIGAAQRQRLINKAVEAKLGTAEEIAKLSNKDLKALLEKAGVTI